MSNYLTERYDLTDPKLDIPEEEMRKGSNEELQAISGISEMTISQDKIAISDMVEYFTKVINEAKMLTSELNFDMLAKAINDYNEKHRSERKSEEEPEMEV